MSVRIPVRKTQAIYRQHRGIALLTLAAAVVHLAAWIAYWPALWYSDSVSYMDLAAHGGMSPTRQMAYPWIARAIIAVGGQTDAVLGFITATQHLAALIAGVLTYAMLRRLGTVNWLALVGAAVFLFDAFSLSVEQTLLSESYYVLCLTASFALLVLRRGDRRALFFSGLLLAGAVWLRSAGLFAIPVWALYIVWTTRAWRPTLLAAAAVALPLVIYMTLYWQVTGVFGFTQTKGWFMYGRVAEIANCKTANIPPGTQRLCPKPPAHGGAAWYIWDWHSPAWRMYGRAPGGNPDRLLKFDQKLGRFATAVIKDNPIGYAGLVVSDLGRFFQPGLMMRGDNDDLTTTFGRYDAPKNLRLPPQRNPIRTFHEYRTPKRFPAPLLTAYSRVIHLPRVPLGLILLAGLVGVAVPRLRREIEHPVEVALLTGAAFCVLLGHAMTSDFALRYMIPVVPLILAGGIPGSRWAWIEITRRRGGGPSSRVPARDDDHGTYRRHVALGRTRGTAGSAH
jgi:hypothetical protein